MFNSKKIDALEKRIDALERLNKLENKTSLTVISVKVKT